jgi:hypothetical protein
MTTYAYLSELRPSITNILSASLLLEMRKTHHVWSY